MEEAKCAHCGEEHKEEKGVTYWPLPEGRIYYSIYIEGDGGAGGSATIKRKQCAKVSIGLIEESK